MKKLWGWFEMELAKQIEKLEDEKVYHLIMRKLWGWTYPVRRISELDDERWKNVTIFGEERIAEVKMEDIAIILRRVNNQGWMRPKNITIKDEEKKYPRWVFNYILKRIVRTYMRFGYYDRAGRLLLWMNGRNNDFVIEFMDVDEFYDRYMKKAPRRSNLLNFTEYYKKYKFAVIKDERDSQIVGIIRFQWILEIKE